MSLIALLPHGDKVGHVALYTVLGAALAWARLGARRPAPHWAYILLGWLYGVSDEWHQSFVPGRDSSAGDLAADAVGVVLGYGAAVTLLTRRGPPGAPPVRRVAPEPEPQDTDDA